MCSNKGTELPNIFDYDISPKIEIPNVSRYFKIGSCRIKEILKLINSSTEEVTHETYNTELMIDGFNTFAYIYGSRMNNLNRFISVELFMSFFMNISRTHFYSDALLENSDKFDFLDKIVGSGISVFDTNKMPFFVEDIEKYKHIKYREKDLKFIVYTFPFFLNVMYNFDDMFYDVENLINRRIWNSELIDDVNLFIEKYIGYIYTNNFVLEHREFIQLFIKLLYDAEKTNKFLNIFIRDNRHPTIYNYDVYSYLTPIFISIGYYFDIYDILTIILKCIDEDTLDKDIEKNIWDYVSKFISSCNREHIVDYKYLFELLLKGDKRILTVMEC